MEPKGRYQPRLVATLRPAWPNMTRTIPPG